MMNIYRLSFYFWPRLSIYPVHWKTELQSIIIIVSAAHLSLVPTCPKNHKNRDFYDLPTSGILTTNVNTPSQMVGDFYDVIGRTGSISALKVLSQTVPSVGEFYDECEHRICLSGTVTDERGFLRWVWTWNLPVWDIGDAWFCLYLLPKLDFQ